MTCVLVLTWQALVQEPPGKQPVTFLMKEQQGFIRVLSGQVPGLYGGTTFRRCDTPGGSIRALNTKIPFFDTFETA